MKFLVVEDDLSIGRLIRYYLGEILNEEVKWCKSIKDSLTWLETSKPDVILLDYYLYDSVMSTEAFSEYIRVRWENTPAIILMTAGKAEVINKGVKAPYVMQKPFSFDDLEKYIDMLRK